MQAGDPPSRSLSKNSPRYYELLWAAQRSGIRFTAISSKLTAGEVEYIVKDCGAKVFIAGKGVAPVALEVAPLIPGVKLYMVDGVAGPFESFEDARAKFPTTPIVDESAGGPMLYSSGTTGRPKGVRRAGPAAGPAPIDGPNPLAMMGQMLSTNGRPTASISPPRRSTTPPRWAGRWRCSRWAAPWC